MRNLFNYTIKSKEIIVGKDPTYNLFAFGDIHKGTKSCDEGSWNRFLKYAEKYPGNKLYLGMGDYHDFVSTSERKKIEVAGLHETTTDTFDDIVQYNNLKFVKEIGFMRDDMLGFLEGNHSYVSKNHKSSTEDLAERMRSEYCGWLCHYTLKFKKNNGPKGHDLQKNVTIIACHGKYGGKKKGTSVNKVEDLREIFPMADIYIMAHDHSRWAFPVSVLVPNHYNCMVIDEKRQLLCRSGSFKKAYVENESNYEVGMLVSPSDIGALRITIQLEMDYKEKKFKSYITAEV